MNKFQIIPGLFFLLLFLSFNAAAQTQNSYQTEIAKWRENREAELKSADGWLALSGLFWLKEGDNTVGVGPVFDVELPAGSAPGQIGVIEFKQKVATLRVNEGVSAISSAQSVSAIELKADDDSKPTQVEFGAVSLTLIKREARFAIRVKDRNSPQLKAFKGLHWYPADEKLRLTARLIPYEKPKEVEIPNVLGGSYKMTSPGLLVFKLNGQEFKLEPVVEENQLFIIFRDLTSKTTTYQAGRFLYAEQPVNGEVVLDFNKAFNPPCSFTPYATCPLPPSQNRLNVEIAAGEKRYHD